jgi:hypothetical protein
MMLMRTGAQRTVLIAAVCLAAGGCGKDDTIDSAGGGAKSDVTITVIPKSGGDAGEATSAAASVAGYGHLQGKVTIAGDVPSLPPLVTAAMVKPDDKDVCVHDRIANQKLVVNGNAVQNVFVYLQRAPAGTKMPEAAPVEVTMDHKTCTFVPHAMVVMTGQPIRVLNDDGIAHNVHTKPTRSGEFNSGIGAHNREGVLTTYKNAERTPARVICDYHTWMLAWHLPLDHPYGAVTNEAGEFEIRDLPAGKHKFTIWHEGNVLAEKDVTIEVDQTAPLDLEFTAADFKVSSLNQSRPRTVVLAAGN